MENCRCTQVPLVYSGHKMHLAEKIRPVKTCAPSCKPDGTMGRSLQTTQSASDFQNFLSLKGSAPGYMLT